MAKCASHMKGDTPRFLKYTECDECSDIYIYRRKTAGTRKALATRTNRATAQINGLPTSATVRSFHVSKLLKTDPWYRKKGS